MIPLLRSLRVVFFGTTDFAAYHLCMLVYCSVHKIVAIFTQETLNNKKNHLSIDKISKSWNLLLLQSKNLSMLDIAHIIKKLDIDIIIIVSYGLILPPEILNIPKYGCINVHASLLPRWRGPAPIPRALENGDNITGISIIRINSGIDMGRILCSVSCKIESTDTSYTLSKKLARIGATSLLLTIDKIILDVCTVIPQNPLNTTYAYKLNKKEARINWNLSAITLERRIRAFNPWPISYFQIKTTRIRVWKAQVQINNISQNNNISLILLPGMILKIDSLGIYVVTGSGILILTELQIENKRKTTIKDILNAYYQWFVPYSQLE